MPRKSKQFPMIDMEKTGKRLQELIESHGYTVNEIQTILIISSHQSIYSWYKGHTMPSIDNFVALSKLLDVSLDDMIICHEYSEKRIESFKVQELSLNEYDVIFRIQEELEKNQGNLEVEWFVQFSNEINVPIQKIYEIAQKYCILTS